MHAYPLMGKYHFLRLFLVPAWPFSLLISHFALCSLVNFVSSLYIQDSYTEPKSGAHDPTKGFEFPFTSYYKLRIQTRIFVLRLMVSIKQ